MFFVCSTSAISVLFVAPRISLCWLHHREDGEEDARTIRREQDCRNIQANGDEPDEFCCNQFFFCEQPDCVEKPGDTQSFKSTGWIVRMACCNHKSQHQSRHSVEFSRLAKRCSTVHQHKETCGNNDVQETRNRRFRRFKNSKVEFGHIISKNHQTVHLTWRKSSRS